MGWWQRVRAALRREATDAGELLADTETRIAAELDRREREMSATPEEKLQLTVEEAARADAEFDEMARRINERRDGT